MDREDLRDRGSVLRTSTWLERRDVVARSHQYGLLAASRLRKAVVDPIQIFARPAHSADLDLSVCAHKHQGGYVRQSVSIRSWIFPGVIESYGQGDSEFPHKPGRVLCRVLGHADDLHVLPAV